MTTFPFPDHTLETAPAEARPGLRATASQLGFVPVAMARQAEAPAVGAAFAKLLGAWSATSFDALEREVVTFAIAHRTGCELCLAFHSRIVRAADVDPALYDALRGGGALPVAKLEALRAFTLSVLDGHGAVSDEGLAAFVAAGYTPRHALELLVGVATYVLSTYANRLVRAPVDAPLAPFAVPPPR